MHERGSSPEPIPCGATLAEGGRCDELATVTNIQYKYDRRPTDSGRDDYILREVRYRLLCPNCGERRLIEPHGD